ncbi:MAG TPA: response regulator transcription factor [Thermoleophilaceae bacterium]|jgi:DNA-binding NarL/FixJ family response regulator|nr:response regulator transcription factor [Thermoleophilaceae bacterium]
MTRTGPARVLIAAADPLVRRALETVLAGPDFELVAETASADAALTAARERNPHVALIDAILEHGDGLQVAEQIAREAPDTRVIVLSASDDDNKAMHALRAGARGYLRKDIELDALPRAVNGVLAGEAAVSRRLTMRVIDELRKTPLLGPGIRPTVSELTPREWQVLDLLTTGASTADIAVDLVLSPETVLTHVKNILRKLGVHSRRDAIRQAERLRLGLDPLTGESGGAAPPERDDA